MSLKIRNIDKYCFYDLLLFFASSAVVIIGSIIEKWLLNHLSLLAYCKRLLSRLFLVHEANNYWFWRKRKLFLIRNNSFKDLYNIGRCNSSHFAGVLLECSKERLWPSRRKNAAWHRDGRLQSTLSLLSHSLQNYPTFQLSPGACPLCHFYTSLQSVTHSIYLNLICPREKNES